MASDIAAGRAENDDAELKGVIATLTDSRRLAIVRALATAPGMGSAEIATWLDLPAPTVRKQLRTLMELGMVHVKKREVRRGVQKLYFLHSRAPWITEEHEPGLSRRQQRTVDLEVLRCVVSDCRKAIAAPLYGDRRGRIVASVPGTVDARAWQEISELQHELLERMVGIVEAGNGRLAESGEEPVTLTSALLLLELPDPIGAGSPDPPDRTRTPPTS